MVWSTVVHGLTRLELELEHKVLHIFILISSFLTLPSHDQTSPSLFSPVNAGLHLNNHHNPMYKSQNSSNSPLIGVPATPTYLHSPAPSASPHARARSNSGKKPKSSSNRRNGSNRNGDHGNGNAPQQRSRLEALFRDGPADANIEGSLRELRYLVLLNKVDEDMSLSRIYLWLALFNVAAFPTDEYLRLVLRGRSPAYAKIKNDTFRTLASDKMFKRRVTEASLSRLLNAVVWKTHDAIEGVSSRSASAAGHSKFITTTPDRAIALNNDITPSRRNFGSARPGTASSSQELYVQGMNVLCAPFLFVARSEVEAFALFQYFITRECPAYVRSTMDGVHSGIRLMDRCLEVVDSELAERLRYKDQLTVFAFPSVMTLCACTPPLKELLHLWDFLFAYGPHLNILCIIAQLMRMRDALMTQT